MPMDVRAAVAYAPGKPLEVTTVQLEGPRAGEVRLREVCFAGRRKVGKDHAQTKAGARL